MPVTFSTIEDEARKHTIAACNAYDDGRLHAAREMHKRAAKTWGAIGRDDLRRMHHVADAFISSEQIASGEGNESEVDYLTGQIASLQRDILAGMRQEAREAA